MIIKPIISITFLDLKFIASVLRLSTNFAKCNNTCPLCHVDKKNFNQFEISAEKTRKIGDFENPGQIREPIINFVPLERVIFDPLHLEMRVSDRLCFCLLNELQQSDLSWNKKNSKNQIKLRDYLISIGIKKPFKTQDNGNFEFRSLTVNKTRTIFKKIYLESLFPDLKNVKKNQSYGKCSQR